MNEAMERQMELSIFLLWVLAVDNITPKKNSYLANLCPYMPFIVCSISISLSLHALIFFLLFAKIFLAKVFSDSSYLFGFWSRRSIPSWMFICLIPSTVRQSACMCLWLRFI